MSWDCVIYRRAIVILGPVPRIYKTLIFETAICVWVEALLLMIITWLVFLKHKKIKK